MWLSDQYGGIAFLQDPTHRLRLHLTDGKPLPHVAELDRREDGGAPAHVHPVPDLGAAGLTSSSVEMAGKGGVGIELNLDAVPQREEGMSAYEMMLSESQERMLMVLDPQKEKQAEAIFRKWGLDFAIVGKTTDTLRFVVKHKGEVMADLPIKELGDQAPLYDRPYIQTPKRPVIDPQNVSAPLSNSNALVKLMGSPDFASKRWVWEQYDHLILGNTVQSPGGDAQALRLCGISIILSLGALIFSEYLSRKLKQRIYGHA